MVTYFALILLLAVVICGKPITRFFTGLFLKAATFSRKSGELASAYFE